MGLSDLLKEIKYFLYPCRCIYCDRAVSKGEVLCPECKAKWEKEKNQPCKNCGRAHINCSCMLKTDEKKRIFAVYHLAEYSADTVARSFVIQMKRRQIEDLSGFIAREMCEHLCRGSLFDNSIVTFVPRRREVVRQTGSDQAMDIAREVAAISGNEMMPTLRRVGKVDQKTLDSEGRKKNSVSSYLIIPEVTDRIKDRSIFIIDDVITTGSTVCACADLLLKNGAKRVVAVSVARKT